MCNSKAGKRKKWPAFIPYIHNVSHKLKNIVAKRDVGVVFAAPIKELKILKQHECNTFTKN